MFDTLILLQFSNDQTFFRIVPSLDGLLYFLEGNKDGSNPTSFDTIKTFPIDIAKATQSNLKFTETSILAGSTDYGVFAVNLKTGDLIYNCSNYGCKQNLQTNSLEEGTLLLFRETSSSIREIGILDGSERWNFTVRDTDIAMVAASPANSNPSSINQARDLFQSSKNIRETLFELDYQFDMLTNALTVYSENTKLWSRNIEAPVIRAWVCSPYHLIKPLALHKTPLSHQMIFLNQYQGKLFVQRLNDFQSAKAYSKSHQVSSLIGFYTSAIDQTTSTQLAPYIEPPNRQKCLAIDPSACEDFNDPLQITFIPSIVSSFSEDFDDDEATLSDWVFDSANDFVALFTGGGYTLGSTTAYRKGPERVSLHSPLFILVFHLTAFVIFVYAVFKLLHLNAISLDPNNIELEQVQEHTQQTVEPPENSNQSNMSEQVTRPPIDNGSTETMDSENNFSSTYDSEFQHLRLLGRGGFGFVFEVINRLDGCRYAIKRIRLQNTPYEKVKFMREVKLWARLDHPGIVRYHRAWVESPPAHWQEQRDKSLRLDEQDELFDEESYDTTTENPGFSIEGTSSRQSNWKISSNSFDLPKAFTDNVESLEFSLNSSDSPFCYLYIQMQLCSPTTLRDWLEAKSTAELRPIRTDLYSMFHQIVEAVNYLHNKSLMHRDLKPSNILFDTEGRIKLADFGLVTRLFEPDPQSKDNEAAAPPRKGRVRNSNSECQTWNDESWMSDAKRTSLDFRHTDNVGTLLYMSPEQEKSQPYDHHVDIFSLGLIFLELMIPFKTTMERICCLTKAKKQELPPEFKERHARESELALMMLALEPSRRPETHDLLAHEILRYGNPFASPTAIPESPINDAPHTRRRLRTLSRVSSMELF
ncbi:hypothetical protein Ciccas_003923 [Cichlidogyrus casuarinus]|uniref:non-specific serine/threonine protein kinase n=1 Tax=Cichlidogyrus casuarinus TaxID=1844966 RepID=A0ABD2QCY9_9PLAT